MSAIADKLDSFFAGCLSPSLHAWGTSGNVDVSNDWNRVLLNDRGRALGQKLAASCKQFSQSAKIGLQQVLHEFSRGLFDPMKSELAADPVFLKYRELSDIGLLNFALDEFAKLSAESFTDIEAINSPKLPNFHTSVAGDTRTCHFAYSSNPEGGRGISGELAYNLADPVKTQLKIMEVKIERSSEGGNTSSFLEGAQEFMFRPFVNPSLDVSALMNVAKFKQSVEDFNKNTLAPIFKAPEINFMELWNNLLEFFKPVFN